jgi:hypothetical protein
MNISSVKLTRYEHLPYWRTQKNKANSAVLPPRAESDARHAVSAFLELAPFESDINSEYNHVNTLENRKESHEEKGCGIFCLSRFAHCFCL